jgi:hypothetical protein
VEFDAMSVVADEDIRGSYSRAGTSEGGWIALAEQLTHEFVLFLLKETGDQPKDFVQRADTQ